MWSRWLGERLIGGWTALLLLTALLECFLALPQFLLTLLQALLHPLTRLLGPGLRAAWQVLGLRLQLGRRVGGFRLALLLLGLSRSQFSQLLLPALGQTLQFRGSVVLHGDEGSRLLFGQASAGAEFLLPETLETRLLTLFPGLLPQLAKKPRDDRAAEREHEDEDLYPALSQGGSFLFWTTRSVALPEVLTQPLPVTSSGLVVRLRRSGRVPETTPE